MRRRYKLWKTNEGQNLWQWQTFQSSKLTQRPHTQRTVLFCQSFSLVVEINLGEKYGGQTCSRGKADQNTKEALLAVQNPKL